MYAVSGLAVQTSRKSSMIDVEVPVGCSTYVHEAGSTND